MQYPLQLTFKIMTLGQRIIATDAGGNVLMFIKQKSYTGSRTPTSANRWS